MSEKSYINRLFDRIVEFTLKSKGALVIVGPNGVGNQLPQRDMQRRL